MTREFGSATRISGVVTSAELEGDAPLEEDVCDHCMRCVEVCPTGALPGEGKINKKLCGDAIFKHGFRFFQQVIQGIAKGEYEEMLGLADQIGTVEVGKSADLVVVRDDPLRDLRAMLRVQWTVKDGVARTPQEWMSQP